MQTGEKEKGLEILRRLPPEQIEDQAEFSVGIALAQLDLPADSALFLAALQNRRPDSYDIAFDLTLVYMMAKDFPSVSR